MGHCRHHARIVKKHGAAVVVMAFDEEGQAATAFDKVDMRQFLPGSWGAGVIELIYAHMMGCESNDCSLKKGPQTRLHFD